MLLADASHSIDDAEIAFQRQSYADALTDPEVLRAITGGYRGRVALIYVEWGDDTSQEVVAGWTVIEDAASAAAFAQTLQTAPRKATGRNAIGSALIFGKLAIETNAYKGERRVIDFSADSANSWRGPDIATARKEVLDAAISINGLAVLCRNCSGRPVDYDLEQAFRDRIVGGPGAFVVTADSPESFAAAVRRKLILEISGHAPEARTAARE